MTHLHDETSPYLLQHADNPVDWYPWGSAALERAREENKPIFLSIGYAACHWCHVMAHESFEDDATAAIMNQHFVNIKVDREERPDLDSIYMTAVQALTGHGGWPMSVFLTPEGEPFYGGTYYPPTPRYGMPAFQQVLLSIADTWDTREGDVRSSAAKITGHLQNNFALTSDAGLPPALIAQALQQLSTQFDAERGGFGEAPKFPPSMTIEFLLRVFLRNGDAFALHMAELTLEKMAHGGMYDQVGGGFARYSTDARWLVPHFEKMLYDNALLARAYLHAWQVTGKPLYKRVVEETLDWVLRDLSHEDGGFYSSYDADNEGAEGLFYVWQKAEIDAILGTDAPLFNAVYGVTEQGNWEGSNVLHVAREPNDVAQERGLDSAEFLSKLQSARHKLLAVRNQRIWPGLDDKVLTAWNGLMLAALSEAGVALQRSDYIAAAVRNADFLQQRLRRENGRLLRTWKSGGTARYNAYLEDYAYLADGLLALYQATFDTGWFEWAQTLAELMLAHFSDEENGGFFDTSADHEALVHRPKTIQDNATPSPNAMAARVLLQLYLYTGNNHYVDTAARMTAALGNVMAQYPSGFAHWLGNAWLLLGEPREIAIIGEVADPQTQQLLAVVREQFRPNAAVAVGQNETIPLLAGRPQIDNRPTAYVCRNFVCNLPVNSAEALRNQLT
ncbi:MAG: thioredoxin domain-containing protein [Anaerolineae bacterium]|nr:thioredoxin domain-containing protein [Anaerolineae bacterium]